MREVASRVFHIFFRPLIAKGIALDRMVEGTGVSLARLRKRNERIDWADLCAILGRLQAHFTEDEFVEVGRSYFRSPALRFAFVIGRALLTPMGFYRFINKPRTGAGNQMFTCVVPTHREISDTECEVELILPDEFEVCWPFFLVSKGNFVEMPRLLGYPASHVELERIPHGGRYHITIRQRTRLVSRILRTLTWPFTVRAAARELRDAHETLTERYHEIEDAKAQLDRQATQLRTAHTVNDLVQRDLDLARTLDTVARALVEQAGFAWAELRLHPTDPEAVAAARTVRFGGDGDHEPPLTRALEVQGQRIGELEVAPRTGANRAEREDLLAFIAPTLAMALQNALSYQALADYRSNLERLVDQRTGELRQARDQLAGTVVELREAQGARQRFFGNVTHEIRTPLSLILLAAADIERRAGHVLDDRARKNLGAVTDGAHKLVRLVDELLLLAAGQEDKLRTNPERTDLGALLGAVVAAWQPAAEAAGLTLTGPAIASLIASVDPVAIERVASNLVSNAVKYTPRGGSIEVELADEPDGLRFSVLDTGIGMSEDLQSRLFGRFERDEPGRHRASGTGLGLSVAKQLVEAHGGTISARPRQAGSGSELRVVLPPAAVIRDSEPRPITVARLGLAPAPPAGEQPVMLFRPSGVSAGTILLAEDDVRLAEVVGRGLADEYTVVIAHDGASALELVAPHQPQMLITDVDMPGINGIELSRRFRELTGDKLAPIIVLSAMLDLGTRMAGLEAGAVDYVTKPFDPLELRARIRSQFRMRDLAVRLQRAEHLSAMGILTAGLAHELRNPANGIVNAVGPLTDLLPRDIVKPETAVSQLLEVLTSCAEQIGFLSRQLLGFRKGVVDLDLRWVPVRELIQRTVSLTHAPDVDIRLDLASEGTVKCAPPLVMQVLTNLLENAIYAAGSGGWVQVRTSGRDGRLSIELSDSGGGVPVQLRERVFEPFFTTKPTGVGTGLGLPLARDIVHRHGGVLEIRERGAHTSFVMELPNYSTLEPAVSAGMMAAPRLR
ncbi:MAG TPA: HAMP domain-containing sensor histidine kinase [Kofleriaceae bacterium]|jgi:signal transduction histidine kinase|nr:HAMP domain-containing sensor histidine kinase [Kofleriaceae bacterium]